MAFLADISFNQKGVATRSMTSRSELGAYRDTVNEDSIGVSELHPTRHHSTSTVCRNDNGMRRLDLG